MLNKPFVLFFLTLFSIFLILGCSGEDVTQPPSSTSTPGGPGSDAGGIPTLGATPCTCSTVDCIEDFLENCGGKGTCYIEYQTSDYELDGHYICTNESDKIYVTLRGLSFYYRPTLFLTNQFYWGLDQKHANLHFAGPAAMDCFANLKDIIIKHGAYMNPNTGSLPGIQFEVPNVTCENVTFTAPGGDYGTTHFMSTGTITIDGCELSSNHELAFGPEDWCGGDCGGYGNPMPADGSEITDSQLDGLVFFDVTGPTTGDTAAFYFRDNSPVTDIYLDSNDNAKVKVVFAGNTFADATGAIVDVNGYFTVDAWGNTTYKGPCYSDALSDFDLTGSDVGSGALNLSTWIYNSTTYCLPEIENLDWGRDGNTVTVTWDTDCAQSSSKVIWGYSCDALSDSASGIAGPTHNVQFTVGETEGCVYFRAISANPDCSCDADTSDCEVDVTNIVISSIQTSFSPLLCAMTVTWTTNVKSSSAVLYGTSCASLTEYATGAGNTTSHSVVCDCTEISGGVFAFKVKSVNSCDSEMSSCQTKRKGTCIIGP